MSLETEQKSMAATTTREEDRKSAGQRRINNVWEYTQALIAFSVVLTTCIGIAWRVGEKAPTASGFPPEWWTILGLVIGFYFGRTNHARVGDGKQD